MSAAGSPSLGAGKQPNPDAQVCLLQEGPEEGSFAHGAVITLLLIFFFLQVIRDVCKVSLFVCIPLS